MAEQYYKNDKPESTGKGYYGNGKILSEDIYKADRLINQKSFYGLGNLVYDKDYP
jgi:antitoxin component YwqK of YwqJK toxin-antitoxin module